MAPWSSSSLYKCATQIALQGYTVEYDEKYPGKGWTTIMWIEK
jgi:hypothetical protein